MASVLTGTLITVAISLLTFFLILYKYFTRTFKHWKVRGVKYIKPVPVLGNFADVLLIRKSIGKFLTDLYADNKGDFFGIWIFNVPHLIVRSPDIARDMLVKNFDYFTDRTIACDTEADPLFGHFLFASKMPDWKTLRVGTSPIFTSGKIKLMIPLMNEAFEGMNQYLFKHTGEVLDVKEICAKVTTDVITSVAFGINAHSFENEKAMFRQVGRKMFGFSTINSLRASMWFFAPYVLDWFKFSFFDPSVNVFCREALEETIKQREISGNKRNDVIDTIISLKNAGNINGLKLEGDIMVAQALQFFAAGFETTSSTITYTLYEMCLQPELQNILRKEIVEVSEKYGYYTYESLSYMKYLDKAVKETLRKYPVLPFLDRKCMKDYKLPGSDVVLEKGTPVYIPMMGMHYDPQYFPDPIKYDPERFSEENLSTRNNAAYFPFGSGPHNCIGERLGLTVSKLGIVQAVHNFAFEKCDKTEVPIVFDPKSFTLNPLHGIWMKVTKINK